MNWNGAWNLKYDSRLIALLTIGLKAIILSADGKYAVKDVISRRWSKGWIRLVRDKRRKWNREKSDRSYEFPMRDKMPKKK